MVDPLFLLGRNLNRRWRKREENSLGFLHCLRMLLHVCGHRGTWLGLRAVGEDAQMDDFEVQDLKEPIRRNDTTETTTALTFRIVLLSFLFLLDRPNLSTISSLYELRKTPLCLALSLL